MYKIKTKLHGEISNEIDKLNSMEIGTEQRGQAVKELTSLLDRAIEIEKIEKDAEEKDKDREIETNLKTQQLSEDNKDRWIRNGLTLFSILSGLGITVWGALKAWKFEETGTVSSPIGRKFVNNLISK